MKYFIPVLCILAILLFSGCVQPPVTPPVQLPITPQSTNNTTLPSTNITANITCNDQCLFDKAVAGNSSLLCAPIASSSPRDECYLRFLPEVDCALVGSNASRQSCYLAAAKTHPELCAKTSAPEECYLTATGCADTNCVALKLGKPEFCTDAVCNYKFAKDGDGASCQALNNTPQKTACLALAGNGSCLNLTNEYYRYKCLWIYAVQTGDIGTCLKINADAESYYSGCVSEVASTTNDPGKCNIQDTQARNLCYYNYALDKGDVYPCRLINYEPRLNDCYYHTALKYLKPDMCNNMTWVDYRITCYSGVIFSGQLSEGDALSCAKVDEEQWKDKCYQRLAMDNLKQEYCGFILNKAERDECNNKFFAG